MLSSSWSWRLTLGAAAGKYSAVYLTQLQKNISCLQVALRRVRVKLAGSSPLYAYAQLAPVRGARAFSGAAGGVCKAKSAPSERAAMRWYGQETTELIPHFASNSDMAALQGLLKYVVVGRCNASF